MSAARSAYSIRSWPIFLTNETNEQILHFYSPCAGLLNCTGTARAGAQTMSPTHVGELFELFGDSNCSCLTRLQRPYQLGTRVRSAGVLL